MSLVQIVAAGMVGVARLVFYTGTPSRLPSLKKAMEAARESFGPDPLPTRELPSRIADLGYAWGSGDGN